MKLRKRTQQQLAAMAAANTDSESSEEQALSEDQYLPEDVCNSADNGQSRQKVPEIIETVIETLGRLGVFDFPSRLALRLTCKKYARGIAVRRAAFNLADPAAREALGAWARGRRWLQRTHSLIIKGQLQPELARQAVRSIANRRPSLSYLKLTDVGKAVNALLSAPLDWLRNLHLSGREDPSSAFKDIVKRSALSGLRCLVVENSYGIDPSALGAALTHFSELRQLKLWNLTPNSLSVQILLPMNALERLEALDVRGVAGLSCVGLLGAGGPTLPALKSLTAHNCELVITNSRPWLGQLTFLSSDIKYLGDRRVVAALNGGSLQTLFLWDNSSDPPRIQWDAFHLPHLTYLSLVTPKDIEGDALGDVARCKMPLLRSAVLPLRYNTRVDSVHALAAAFTQLRELTLQGNKNALAAQDAVLVALAGHVVPTLESLEISLRATNIPSVAPHLLPWGPLLVDGPLWPRLRQLTLQISEPPFYYGSRGNERAFDEQKDFFAALGRTAPQCPALVSLHIKVGYRTQLEAVEAMILAAFENQDEAWPLLRDVRLNNSYIQKNAIFERLHEVWPQATLE